MTNKSKLEEAIKLLWQVVDTWDEDDVIEYKATMSFDEIVAELQSIKLK